MSSLRRVQAEMNGTDLKKALKLRHEIVRWPSPGAAEAARAVREICALVGWDADAAVREVETRAAGTAALASAYVSYLGNELRDRLNQVKWDFIKAHPSDPAVGEIVALARLWQRQGAGTGPGAENGYDWLSFPADEEAYEDEGRDHEDDR
jgi:hypothetical protein